ncbi:MAG: quinone oxidoreductase [Chthoniobacterales bacterium]
MKAIRLHSQGGPEVLQFEDVPLPELKPGEALVRVNAAGVNFLDVYQRTGLYKIPLPFTPGMEGAGTIERVSGDSELQPGARVNWTMQPGAYAEFAAVPAWKLVQLPDGIDFQAAAAAMLQGMTAQYLCETTYPVKAGDSVLVHAGAGGVGLLLIQLLRRKGAKVFTTVSTDAKAALAKEAGADEAILYTKEDFVAAVKAFTKGQGVQVVYDSVGASTYEGSLNVLRPLGMLVLFGQSGGRVPPIDPINLTDKGSLFLARPSLGHHIADRNSLLERASKVLGWVATGALKVRIGKVYPLSGVPEAHRDLEARKTTGKLIIDVTDDQKETVSA